MDCIVYRIAKSWTRLSDLHFDHSQQVRITCRTLKFPTWEHSKDNIIAFFSPHCILYHTAQLRTQ